VIGGLLIVNIEEETVVVSDDSLEGLAAKTMTAVVDEFKGLISCFGLFWVREEYMGRG
jgi:hypothetical protein